MLRRAVGLLIVGACGLGLAVVAFASPPPGGTGPPTWVPGPPPCHGHSPCPPPQTVTSTSTVTRTTTVSTTTTTTKTTTDTVSRTSTVVEDVGVPGPPSGPPEDADVSVTVDGPSGPVYAGDRVTYTVTVANAGPSSATGVHLGLMPSGSRVLTSAAGDLGELDAGASTTETFTLAPNGTGTISATFTTGADQPDPQLGNNVVVVSTPVLVGHAGAPGLQTPTQGAFAPPLLAVRRGQGWMVTTRVYVDEAATVTVHVVDRAGKAQSMLPGTLVDWLPANRPHLSIPHTLTAPGWMPLRIRIGGGGGLSYRIVVQATGPDGSAASTTIGFRTP